MDQIFKPFLDVGVLGAMLLWVLLIQRMEMRALTRELRRISRVQLMDIITDPRRSEVVKAAAREELEDLKQQSARSGDSLSNGGLVGKALDEITDI